MEGIIMADNQPTILVKKADGTFVRVPLSELKKKSTAPVTQPVVAPVVAEPIAAPAPIVVPEKKPEKVYKSWSGKEFVSTPKAVLPSTKKIEEKIVVKEKPTDFQSLLEEDELIMSALGPKTSATRDTEVDNVIKQLSFVIPASFVGRLRNIVQLRLKDVRGQSETKDIVLLSIKDGGLGLTEAQAEELEKKCVAKMGIVSTEGVVPLKTKAAAPVAKNISADLPQKFVEPAVPANTTPFNNFIHGDAKNNITENIAPEFKISSAALPKPVMRDITVKPIDMGPVDEIRFFRLLDWRRLANNPAEAANRLKQKFINLKEESIVLFMEAAAAWRESPIYQEYLSVVDKAFTKKTNVGAVIIDKEGINLEEIKALVKMEKELGI